MPNFIGTGTLGGLDVTPAFYALTFLMRFADGTGH